MSLERKTAILLLAATFLFSAGGTSAESVRNLVRAGNRLFAQQKYDEALQKYRNAQTESPQSPYLHFNIANALQHQGEFDEAVAEYRKAYSRERPSLGTWALYNIGVGQFRQAEQALGAQDLPKAIKSLEACVESNREAMKLDPTDEDPKFNYEQAKRLLEALKKQMQEQKQQQKQQDQQKQDQQDQQEQDQQKQDQQKQDQQKQDQQEQSQQDDQQQQGRDDRATSQPEQSRDQPTSGTSQQQAPPREGEMSPEEAERILNLLPDQNDEDMRRFLRPRGRAVFRIEKDW